MKVSLIEELVGWAERFGEAQRIHWKGVGQGEAFANLQTVKKNVAPFAVDRLYCMIYDACASALKNVGFRIHSSTRHT